MIGMKCEISEKWKEIMINKSKLEGSDIYIEKGLTWQEREMERKLIGFAKEQAGKGKKTLTGKEWRRAEPKEGKEENEDNSMEYSGRQRYQPQDIGLFKKF
ncbi:hypothetical protein QAD02_007986 [Eretmocerus hayati]|uniref:Uncharacterized protein n=1 Tax=Eretmocerus hayati TaxID=131215 RepID=A0ACC2N594_9HYME|nr:hypothetical protein QAD02_007986 [Eretmocerus hayati]